MCLTEIIIKIDWAQFKNGETYTAKNESNETAEQFIDLINELMRIVWVTGETKPHKKQLKALKFQWHSKK